MCRGLGPFGPNLVRRYAGARFGTNASGTMLNEQESKLFSGVFFLCFMHVLENLTGNLGNFFLVNLKIDTIFHYFPLKKAD
jgi:hypothetical protein